MINKLNKLFYSRKSKLLKAKTFKIKNNLFTHL